MEETRRSWLERLQRDRHDDGWSQLLELYGPFIRSILERQGITGNDHDDIVQSVLTVIVRRLPDFDRQRTGSFRKWLRQITSNALHEYWRTQRKSVQGRGRAEMPDSLAQLDDPNSALSRFWDAEHNRFVLAYMLRQVRGEFRRSTWQAFEMVAVDQMSAKEVAEKLGMTENAVFIARSRVMKRLKEVAADLLD